MATWQAEVEIDEASSGGCWYAHAESYEKITAESIAELDRTLAD